MPTEGLDMDTNANSADISGCFLNNPQVDAPATPGWARAMMATVMKACGDSTTASHAMVAKMDTVVAQVV
jgi:hypothetical protein